MICAAQPDRPYDFSHFQALFENTRGWAESWNEVLRYLHGPALYHAEFSTVQVAALINDIEEVKMRGLSFTRDYAQLWVQLTNLA